MTSGKNAEVVLGGMISGLASTGLYEMMRNLLDKDGSLSLLFFGGSFLIALLAVWESNLRTLR